MNRSSWRSALEVAPLLLVEGGKVTLRTPFFVACSYSVRRRGWWRHLMMSLSRWLLGRLNVTYFFGT